MRKVSLRKVAGADFWREIDPVNTPRLEPFEPGRSEIRLKAPPSYPATNGRAGGKLPAGNDTSRFPARSFSEASRKAATNHPYIS